MILPRRSRRYVTPPVWCGLVLGLAVVLWGVSYKMMQYPEDGLAFRVMSPAKLLTEKERPPEASNTRVVLPVVSEIRHHTQPPAWIASALRRSLFSRPAGILLPAVPIRGFIHPELSYFSFRPPPSRATA